MIAVIDRMARPLLRRLDPERAHRLALAALALAPLARRKPDPAELSVQAFGLRFPNPVGIAAGFDKNAAVPDPLLHLGFGFVEIGTVTPRPQAGNPRPRVFRLEADAGVINRLGFNGEGADAVLRRLSARAARGGIVGVNVGANRDSTDRAADYAHLIARFAPYASYFTANISSPNTPGLRDLQHAAALDDLLARAIAARDEAASRHGRKPLLVKIAPDLTLDELDDVVAIARRRAIDGMIIGNTTVARPASLRDRATAAEAGGLSGRPLFARSTRMLAETYLRVDNAFALIGVGGIDSGAAAVAKIRAGARLVQLYSGLVFTPLALIDDIKSALGALRHGAGGWEAAIGCDAAAMAQQPWPE